jgi:hypothetical protein
MLVSAGCAIAWGGGSEKNKEESSHQDQQVCDAPHVKDSDRDGFSDDMERSMGTHPHSAASRPTLADRHEKISAYWPLKNHAGEVLDGELNGILESGARFRKGALELDGHQAHVNFGASPALSFSGDFTYCLWLKPKANREFERVLGKIETQTDESEYGLFLGLGGIWSVLSSDGSMDWDKTIWQWAALPSGKKDAWLHLGVSWERALGADGMRMHVNGRKFHSIGWGVDGLDTLFQGTANLTLGTFDVIGSEFEDAFNGSVAQMVFCSERLTDLEMKEIYWLGQDGDLVAYLNMDSDRDGLPDWWERRYFGDVRLDGRVDSDGDGLTNAQELQWGTNPKSRDTDGDGFTCANYQIMIASKT